MTAFAFTDAPQIDELPECWTSEEIDRYLEQEEQFWDDDAALESYSLECAFGPND
jgi:hypothetical protein